MKIPLSDLTTARNWRAATGFDKHRVETLLAVFKAFSVTVYGKPVEKRQVQTGITYWLNSEEELFVFTLFSLQSGLPYDWLGLVCGMEASNAKRPQKTGVKVLPRIFQALGSAPKRKFMKVNACLEYFADTEALIIAATEQTLQRPSDKTDQKQFDSGNKNAYGKSHAYQRHADQETVSKPLSGRQDA